jgi:hypothetical protein
MKKLILTLAVIFSVNYITQAQNLLGNYWETNGQVNATVKLNNKTFIGGEFNYVGPSSGVLGCYQLSQTKVVNKGLIIDGQINAMVSDNQGNIYMGGDFSINGGTRLSLAKFSSAMVPDNTFNFSFNGTVQHLAINNNCLFAAGNFSSINNQTRLGVAGIELNGNTITSFSPNPDGPVLALNSNNGVLYIGGSFNLISGAQRGSIAAYDGARNLLPLSVPVYGVVSSIVSVDSLLFIAGSFDTIASIARKNLASINLTTGQLRNWRADITGSVKEMRIASNILYLGGTFFQVGSAIRNNLAAVNVLTNTVTSFNPGIDGPVNAISIRGNTLYAGGNFNSIGFDNKSFLAGISISNGSLIGTIPNVNGEVNVILANSDTLLAAGSFSSFGGKNLNNFAVIDNQTGEALDNNLEIDGPIFDLELVGNEILIAGDFTSIGSSIRVGVAIVDTALVPTSWDALSDGKVNDAIVIGNTIYLAGEFTALGADARNSLALVNATSGALLVWNPNANGPAKKLYLNQSNLYVIGDFSQIGSTARNRIASFNLQNAGALRSWSINPDSTIYAITSTNNAIIIGGLFTQIGSISRSFVAALDTGNAAVLSWQPQVNGAVRALEEDNGLVFIGGDFSSNIASGFTCYNLSSNQELNFPIKLESGHANSIKQIDQQLFVSGSFIVENANGKENFAVIQLNIGTPTLQASNVTITGITPTSMKLRFNKGNGAKYLVLGKQGSAVDSFPSNGMVITANPIFGNGMALGSNFAVYNGTDSTVEITGLNTGTSYHFAVFAYNGFGSNTNYLQSNPARGNASTIISYSPPTVAATNIQFSDIRINQMMVKWTNGNGSGRYLVAKEATAVNQIPSDSTFFNGNNIFGFGDDLGAANYVLYNATADSVLVTGLKAGTIYHFKVFEFNGVGQFTRVLSTGPNNNASTLAFASEPNNSSSNLTFSNTTANSVQLNWTNGNGTSRIVVASRDQAVSTLPMDGETYQTDNTFNGNSSYLSNNERVVYIGTGNQFTLSGLEPNTTYHFAVIESNGSNFTINYQSQGFLTGNKKTNSDINIPTQASKNISFTKVGSDSLAFSWTSGNGEKRIVIVQKESAVTAQPNLGKTYTPNAQFGLGDSIAPGNYVVYADNGNSTLVTGLEPNTNYHIAIYEYNESVQGALYLLDSFAVGNAKTLPLTGLFKIKGTGSIKVYPNPVIDGTIYLNFEKPLAPDARVYVYDITGKLVVETKLLVDSKFTSELALKQLDSGSYFLKVVSGNDIFQNKIQVQ